MTLSIRNLKYERNYRDLFHEVNFDVFPRDCLQIVGANGSGKTTLLRILAGFLEPKQGAVLWNSLSIFEDLDAFQQQIQYLGHKNAIKLSLTVYENIQLYCALFGKSLDKIEIARITEQMGLSQKLHAYANQLSAGQLRRLSLIKLLLRSTPLWILDEPLTALDLDGQSLWLELLNNHLNNNGMVIMTTHQNMALGPSSKKLFWTPIMFKQGLVFVHKEIQITYRQTFSWAAPLFFFVIIVCLFPFAVGPAPALLNKIAPGIIWVAALLAILISIGYLFRQDEEEGLLDLFLLSTCPLALLVFFKILGHWLTHCLPLILISPLLGALLKLSPGQEHALIISLLLGTPVFCLIGAIGAALIIGIRSHGFLLPILILPFYVPVLVFGTSCVMAAGRIQPVSGYFAVLGALLLFSLAFSPLFTALALRMGVNDSC